MKLDDLRRRPAALVQEEFYFSRALGEERPYHIIAPSHPKEPLPLMVLLHGMNANYRDWCAHTRIARYASAFQMAFAFPDGGNHWYSNRYDQAARWEDDLLGDFLPHLQTRLPLLPAGRAWGIGGMSMGGYGAVKIALKRPDLFGLAISHSGSFEKPMSAEFHPVFGDPEQHRAFRKSENPYVLAERLLCEFPIVRPFLFLDCGREDAPFLEVNRRFKDHLRFLGYPNDYHEAAGHHTWPYWDRAIRRVLPLAAAQLGASPLETRG